MSGHSTSSYTKIYIVLVVLFIISYVVPEVSSNQAAILISAFGIAVVKALVVAAYFMHLNTERKFVWYMLITTLSFMYLFYIALAPDIMKKEGHNWKSNIVVEVPEDTHHGDDSHAEGEKH